MGLSREDAIEIHRLYLSALGRLALEDHIVTPAERADLALVAGVLGLSADDVAASLAPAALAAASACEVGGFILQAGDLVVFTGDAPGVSRADLEYQALTFGLRVAGAVSKRTRLVVAADPDSLSGKARKAHELEIPIVDCATFLGMLDSVSRQRPSDQGSSGPRSAGPIISRPAVEDIHMTVGHR